MSAHPGRLHGGTSFLAPTLLVLLALFVFLTLGSSFALAWDGSPDAELSWAVAQVGKASYTDPRGAAQTSANRPETFVETVFNVSGFAISPNVLWSNLTPATKHPFDVNAPRGALLFWSIGPNSSSGGQVAVSLGDGWHIDAGGAVVARERDSVHATQNYLGWGWAPFAWQGRTLGTTFATTRLTNDSLLSESAQVSGDRIAWVGHDGNDQEIYTWTPSSGTVKITNNTYADIDVRVSGDRIVWTAFDGADTEVFTWTPTGGTVKLTNNSVEDFMADVSGDRVVWQQGDGATAEIYRWAPSSGAIRMTNDSRQDTEPHVSGDRIVWSHFDGTDTEIYTWKLPAGVTKITNNTFDDGYVQVSGDRVVWRADPGPGPEIYTWTPSTDIVRLTDNEWTDEYPVVSGDRVAWLTFDTAKNVVYTWTLGMVDPVALPNTGYEDSPPAISGDRIVWSRYMGTGENNEIFSWTPVEGSRQITSNIGMDVYPAVSGDRIAWQGEGNVVEVMPDIFTAIPSQYDQTDSRLLFAGSWQTSSSLVAAGGSYVQTTSAGSSMTVAANGTTLSIVFRKADTMGIASIYVDGTPVQTLDLYAYAVQSVVWSAQNLTDGLHIVKVLCTGAKSASSGGNAIAIDGVRGSLAPVVGDQDTDSRLLYNGTWSSATQPAASGGSYRYASSNGASVIIPFNGQRLDWTGVKGPNMGIASVSLDGGTPKAVSLDAPSLAFQKFTTGKLTNGYHRLTISWSTANTAGKQIAIDAVQVVGALVARSRFDQTDPHLSWTGSWAETSAGQAVGGGLRSINATGSLTVRFTGVYAGLVALKGPVFGIAKVTCDGGTPAFVDLYASSAGNPVTVWSSWLGPGNHTIKVEWTNTKSSGSTCTIDVDAVDIRGLVW